MFAKYGNFETAEEINAKAEELFNQGDMSGIKVLAKENGIEEEIAVMYMSGDVPELCDQMSAALGKIEVEMKELKLEGWGIMEDWVEYIRSLIFDSESVQIGVRKKEKTLAGAIALLLKWSSENRKQLPREICKAAGVPENVYMGTPGMGKAKELMKEYYGG